MPGEGSEFGAHRSTRNTWLAVAAGIGVVAAVLELAAHALYFADGLSAFFYPTTLKVSDGLDILGSLLGVGAFAVGLAGFVVVAQQSRRRLLGIAAILFAAGALTSVAVQLIRGVEFGTNGAPGTFTASQVVEAAAWLAFAAAAVLAAIAFLSSAAGREPNRGLGWAGVGLAFFFVLQLVSTLLELIAYSDFHAPSGITSGLGVAVGGDAVAAAGAVVVAVAFLVAASRTGWPAGRDGLLAIGVLVVGIGFLLSSIGGMIFASAASPGEDGKYVAAAWLDAINVLGLSFAVICASVGFASSRRAAQPAQPPAADFGSA